MPRALLCDLAQTWTADRHRRAHCDAPAVPRIVPATRGHPTVAIAPASSRPWWRTVPGSASAR